MLTIRFDILGVRPGDLVLDAGAGFGRHAFGLARRGADVVALDYAVTEVRQTASTFDAMIEAGEIDPARCVGVLRGDATRLPFPDATFDRVITSEVLEHIRDDAGALHELERVLKPGGTFAATVPAWLPEKLNWMLSDEYHAPKVEGGHLRIYRAAELADKLRSAGLTPTSSHRAHALHSPYWWLKCAVGPGNDDHPLVARFRRLLEWEIVSQPAGLRHVERVLAPVIGKSYVVYCTKAVSSLSPIRTELEVAHAAA
jgi:SAM-dependent methyltransferase